MKETCVQSLIQKDPMYEEQLGPCTAIIEPVPRAQELQLLKLPHPRVCAA